MLVVLLVCEQLCCVRDEVVVIRDGGVVVGFVDEVVWVRVVIVFVDVVEHVVLFVRVLFDLCEQVLDCCVVGCGDVDVMSLFECGDDYACVVVGFFCVWWFLDW